MLLMSKETGVTVRNDMSRFLFGGGRIRAHKCHKITCLEREEREMTSKFPKKHRIILCIALIFCLISSIGASVVQTSFGTVRVEDIDIIAGEGTKIHGQIYIPKKASADNKLPLIVVSHGSYNNLDMQDLNMIELSRRGFVVISSDAYNHGSSDITPADISGLFPGKNMYQLIDYACASFDFIDTDKIAISGHSMGGMISNYTAQHYFEQEALGLGENRIAAVLDVGTDPQYTPYEFEGVADPVLPDVDWGLICAKYDEWFMKGETGNPALYLESDAARSFINQLEGVDLTGPVENGRIYTGTINGEEHIRAIFQNTEIHPLNHFSMNSAADAITFFYASLGVPSGYEEIASGNQIWMFKEAFNSLGLIGIFLFLFPFASLLIHGTTFFAELKADRVPAPAPALNNGKKKSVYWATFAINTVIPALLVMPVMLYWVGKGISVPATVTSWFGEPNTNELATWTAIVAICQLAVFLVSYYTFRTKDAAMVPECWGLATTVKKVWKGFLLALATVTTAYVILFFSDLVFNTDYRIWVIAMRVFTVDKILYAIAYFPAFALFYLVNSMLVNGGNRVESRPTWRLFLISFVGNILGIVVLIFIQYFGIIVNGTFTFNSMRIVNLFPLVVLIPAGTVITHFFYKLTGKIYAGSFAVSMLYTMMTVSNTMFTASILG